MAKPFILHKTVSDAAMEHAVWTIGGYPQVPWEVAVKNLIDGIRGLGFNELRPSTIWRLGRDVVGRDFQYVDLEAVRKWTPEH